MRKPDAGLLSEEDLFLFLDYYELTSGKCNFEHGMNRRITENYFFREIPEHLGAYMLAAGLEQVVAHVQAMNKGLSKKQRRWLARTAEAEFRNEAFLDYLENFRFRGDIYAVPEGTPVFPNEPIINVTGPSIDVQMLETCLLNVMNFETLVATKASRIVHAARGCKVVFTPDGTERGVVDFGARRAHGRDAALLGARAAFIGGAAGSSLVIAGMKWGMPYVGTMPHKFIQERYRGTGSFKESELAAFRQYAESFPTSSTMLVDTYDSIEGARNAVAVGLEMKNKGHGLRGVRLDSGNLVELSQAAARMLREAGLPASIFISESLDEYQIDDMLSRGAVASGFGVGTRLITGANYNALTGEGGVSALNGIYKFAENTDERGRAVASMKFTSSASKATLPGRKQVFRRCRDGRCAEDIIGLWGERFEEATPLLVPIMLKGELVFDCPAAEAVRRYAAQQLAMMPDEYRKLAGAPAYPVRVSEGLARLRDGQLEEFRREYPRT